MKDSIDDRARWIGENILPHEKQIRSWLRRNRLQDLEVDDIIQDMYAKFASMPDVHLIERPKNYAFQVAHSIFLANLRKPRIVSLTIKGDLEDLHAIAPGPSPEDEVSYKDQVREVMDALKELPERTREVFLLRRVEEYSQRETASRLSVSEKAVEKHMTRAILFIMERFGKGRRSANLMTSIQEAARLDGEIDV